MGVARLIGSCAALRFDMETFVYESWAAAFRARMEQHKARVLGALRSGGVVLERLGSLVKPWRLGSGPFVEPYNSDAAYLADHLMSRHEGFGATHEIDGTTYRLGLAQQAEGGAK